MDELKAGNAAGDGPGEERRRICRALTSVLRQSPLSEDLDPKSFFMMLNSNFDMLYISGAPTWSRSGRRSRAAARPTSCTGSFSASRRSRRFGASGFVRRIP